MRLLDVLLGIIFLVVTSVVTAIVIAYVKTHMENLQPDFWLIKVTLHVLSIALVWLIVITLMLFPPVLMIYVMWGGYSFQFVLNMLPFVGCMLIAISAYLLRYYGRIEHISRRGIVGAGIIAIIVTFMSPVWFFFIILYLLSPLIVLLLLGGNILAFIGGILAIIAGIVV